VLGWSALTLCLASNDIITLDILLSSRSRWPDAIQQALSLAIFVSPLSEAQQILASDILTDQQPERIYLLYRLCSGISTNLVPSAVFLSYRNNRPLYDGILQLRK
jgi:hypothetical protein